MVKNLKFAIKKGLLVADPPATLNLVELAALLAGSLRGSLRLVGVTGYCLALLCSYLSDIVGCNHEDCYRHEPHRNPSEGYEAVHSIVEVSGCPGPLLVDHVTELEDKQGGHEDGYHGSRDKAA